MGDEGAQEAMEGVRSILQMVGEDPGREGLLDTPKRVAKAFREMTVGYTQDPEAILGTMFSENADEMVVVTGLEFVSLCEHHLMPFTGTAAIGYVPGGKVVGLSKIPRLLLCYAKRLQIQERLTRQVAQAMYVHLGAKGVGVVIRASHSCMSCRGVEKSGSMVTSSMLGIIRQDNKARSEFLDLARQG